MAADPDGNLPVLNVEATLITGATFQVNNATLYIQVVTLSINRQGFKRSVSSNINISETIKKVKDNNLQQEIYYIIHIIKIIINSLAYIYHDRQIQPFLNKLALHEN